MRVVFERVIKFLFPEKCLVCKIEGDLICLDCAHKLPVNVIDKYNTLAIFPFRDKAVNKLLWNLKYFHTKSVADNLTQAASFHVLKWLSVFDTDQKIFLIPMPKNENDRRLHNHAFLIANKLKDILISYDYSNTQILEHLVSKNSKKKQAHIKNKHMRMKNVEGKFLLNNTNSKIPQDGLVVVVDDITTTGASIAEVKKLISENHNIPYENILAVTLAH